MSQKNIRRMHGILYLVQSLWVLATGVLLILACLQIYRSGEDPFTRESVGDALRSIAPLGILCVFWAVGSGICSILWPLEATKQKGSLPLRVTLNRLRAKLDPSSISDDTAKAIRKHRILRTALTAAAVVLHLVGAALALVYVTNKNNFSAADANREIIDAALAVLLCMAVPFLFSIALAYINKASMTRELALCKSALAAQAAQHAQTQAKTEKTNSIAAFFKKNETVLLTAARVVLLLGGIALVIAGILNGGAGDVVQKAIKICTECIGLG